MRRVVFAALAVTLCTGCFGPFDVNFPDHSDPNHWCGTADPSSIAQRETAIRTGPYYCGKNMLTVDLDVTNPDTVISNVYLNGGCIRVHPTAKNSKLVNSYVRADHVCYVEGIPSAVTTGENNYDLNFTIEDSIVRLEENSSTNFDNNGVGQTGVSIYRSAVFGGAKIVKCDGWCIVEDSVLKDKNDVHGEAFFYDGGDGHIVLRHNLIDPKPGAITTGGVAFTSGYPNQGTIFLNGNEVWGGDGRPFVGCHRNGQPNWAVYCNNITVVGNIFHDETDSQLPSYGFADPSLYPSLNLVWGPPGADNVNGNGTILPPPGPRP